MNESVLYLFYLSLASLFLTTVERSMINRAASMRSRILRVFAFERVLAFPFHVHQSQSTSDLIAALTLNHIPTAVDGWSQLASFCRLGTTALAGLVVSMLADAYLTLLLLACVLPSLFCINVIVKLATKPWLLRRDVANAEGTAIVRDALSKVEAVQYLQLEREFEYRYSETLPTLRRMTCRLDCIQEVCNVGLTSLSFCLAYGLVVWKGGHRVKDGTSDAGDVIVVLFSTLSAGWSASQSIGALHRFLLGIRAERAISASLEDKDAEEVESDEDRAFEVESGHIELKNVSFQFPGSLKRTLAVSFEVLPRESVAICGSSGSGKSTIIDLLLQLYCPDSGCILIDGIDLRSLSPEHWRRAISYVPQEVVFFQGSVFENLTVGVQNVRLQDVIKACQLADCASIIEKLPGGYDTVLEVTSLSGGQRQRIGLARAFLKNSRVWLLDEWSSALDSATEHIVGRNLALVDATMVSVAHRLPVIRSCDRVLVLQDGCIVGNGTHAQLANENQAYKKLLSQMDGEIKADDKVDVGIPHLRQSILSRNSVRLSIIPESIKRQLDQSDEIPKEVVQTVPYPTEGFWTRLLLYAGSALYGTQFTAYALIMSSVIGALIEGDSLVRYSVAYIAIGFTSLFVYSVVAWCQAGLTTRLESFLRGRVFAASIALPMEWKAVYPWTKTLLLLSEVRKLAVTYVHGRSTIVRLVTSTIASLVASLVSCPKLASVILATAPLHVACRAVEAYIDMASSLGSSLVDQANTIAITAIKDIRAVKSLSYGPRLTQILSDVLKQYEDRKKRLNILQAGVEGVANFVVLNTVALSIYYGTTLIIHQEVSLSDMMCAFLSSYFLLSYDSLQLGSILKKPAAAVEQEVCLEIAS